MSEKQDSTEDRNFIWNIIEDDLKANKNKGQVVTRFPPEPNGYLHIGHSKSVCLNFETAKKYGGRCHLRFDDTNPEKEDQEYIDSIQEDIKWLGYNWEEHLYFASDYFDELYQFAVELIKKKKAFVCDLTFDELRHYRGTLKEGGKESPYRNRSVEENLDLFQRMKNGEFEDGSKTLRAKIDMNSPNLNMRDPVLYRIKKVPHPKTKDKWCLYPMYDFTHCLSDALEGITHSLCTLEFEDHRALYDWTLDEVSSPCHPQQIEFARLNIDYTVTSKRKLLELIQKKHVSGWDDPRMPTLKGLRRRGFTPHSIRQFNQKMGVGKKNTIIDYTLLEDCLREELNHNAKRAMVVLNPVKVVITNFDDDKVLMLQASIHPKNESMGKREIPLAKEIFIDRDDFLEDPPKKYFRLAPRRSVRLRYGYVITCDQVVKDDSGNIVELRCSYVEGTLGGKTPEGMKKVKGIIHWVSCQHAIDVDVNLYDRLFSLPNPTSDKDRHFCDFLNPNSLNQLKAKAEPFVKNCQLGEHYQFERVGYFCLDSANSTGQQLVFNRSVTLRDTWLKVKGN